VVAALKAGVSVPLRPAGDTVTVSALKSALVLAARVTTTVYALVAPLWAVTVIVAVCGTPTTKLLRVWGVETLAFVSAFVPVTVIELIELATLTV
jgi:hypothetical protein